MLPESPCVTCGACCAWFRVSFYWLEADPDSENPVPIELTEDLPPYLLCMKGTNQNPPRCAALIGQVGSSVSCAIYSNRPSPCREFGGQYQDGRIISSKEEIERCNRVRARWNLPALSVDDAPKTWNPSQMNPGADGTHAVGL